MAAGRGLYPNLCSTTHVVNLNLAYLFSFARLFGQCEDKFGEQTSQCVSASGDVYGQTLEKAQPLAWPAMLCVQHRLLRHRKNILPEYYNPKLELKHCMMHSVGSCIIWEAVRPTEREKMHGSGMSGRTPCILAVSAMRLQPSTCLAFPSRRGISGVG